MGFCGRFAKALLIIFNFIFWLSGAAILGIGIWMIVDKNIGSYFEVLNIDTHDQFFKYSAYILIAFGIFVFLVGFCGCCGAIRGSKCLLGTYVFFLVLIFAGELAAGILMLVYKGQIEDQLETTLRKSIQEKYGESSTVTDAWDIVQIQLDCCGGKNADDYVGSKYTVKTNKSVPMSCCVLTNKDKAEEKPAGAVAKNETACLEKRANFYNEKGCVQGLKDWEKKHSNILIGVGMGIAFLQLFGIIVALCLCRQLSHEEKY